MKHVIPERIFFIMQQKDCMQNPYNRIKLYKYIY